MPHDATTFGLALVAFALLATDAARRWRGARSTALTRTTALVVAAHVGCVWTFRFDLSFAAMWQKNPFAFVLFHGALLLIVASAFVSEPARDRLVWGAFAVVCMGALPAPFRYPEIAVLQIPVLAVFVAAIAWALRRR